MFLLHLLPEWMISSVITVLLILGIVGAVVTLLAPSKLLAFVPTIAAYFRLIQVLSVVFLIAGVFLSGAYNTEVYWRQKLEAESAKLKIAEAKSALTNEIIKEKIIYKTRIIKERAAAVTSEVNSNAALTAFDKECPLPDELFKLHNDATRVMPK